MHRLLTLLTVSVTVAIAVVAALSVIGQATHKHDALLIFRINDSPTEHVLHFHAHAVNTATDSTNQDASSAAQTPSLTLRPAFSPLTRIPIQTGDTLHACHMDSHGRIGDASECIKVSVPGIGEWFELHYPPGSSADASTGTAHAVYRLMQVNDGSFNQLLAGSATLHLPRRRHHPTPTTPSEAEAAAKQHSPSTHPLSLNLPHHLLDTVTPMQPEERAQHYKKWLQHTWPTWPESDIHIPMPHSNDREPHAASQPQSQPIANPSIDSSSSETPSDENTLNVDQAATNHHHMHEPMDSYAYRYGYGNDYEHAAAGAGPGATPACGADQTYGIAEECGAPI